MRADHQVHVSCGEAIQSGAALLRFGEPRQTADGYRMTREALRERTRVLFREQCGGHQKGHLLARMDCAEGSAGRELRLAEANVPADQTIHGARQGEVRVDFFRTLRLVRSVIPRKGSFEGSLLGVGLGESEPR